MASTLACGWYILIRFRFAGVCLEYDLYYHVRGDRLAAEANSSKPFPGVLIKGLVVSHIDEGLGITCPRIRCNLDSRKTITHSVMVHSLSPS